MPDGEGEPDADGFWERVATNLVAARLRLLFVADDIPDLIEDFADWYRQVAVCGGGPAARDRSRLAS